MKNFIYLMRESGKSRAVAVVFAFLVILGAGFFGMIAKNAKAQGAGSQILDFTIHGGGSRISLHYGQTCNLTGRLKDLFFPGNGIPGEKVQLQWEGAGNVWQDRTPSGSLFPSDTTDASGIASMTWFTEGTSPNGRYRLFFAGNGAFNEGTSASKTLNFDGTPPNRSASHDFPESNILNTPYPYVPHGTEVTIRVEASDPDSPITKIIISESINVGEYKSIKECDYSPAQNSAVCEAKKSYDKIGDNVEYYGTIFTTAACNGFNTLERSGGSFLTPTKNRFTVSGADFVGQVKGKDCVGQCNIKAGDTVTFVDRSTAPDVITSWFWLFCERAADCDPDTELGLPGPYTVRYNNAGTYSVSLDVIGGYEDKEEKIGYVEVSDADAPAPPGLSVEITDPEGGDLVKDDVTISAIASAGINSVEFLVDGGSKGVDNTSPFSISWDTTNDGKHGCPGSHTHRLTARGLDASGSIVANSPAVVVKMNNPSSCPVDPDPDPDPDPIPDPDPDPTPTPTSTPPGTMVIFDIKFLNPLKATTVGELITAIINFLTFIIIPIAILLILYAAFRYMIMGAIPDERKKAIRIIQFALAGIVVVLLARVIEAIVRAIFK